MYKFFLLIAILILCLAPLGIVRGLVSEVRAPSINIAPLSYYPFDEMLYLEGVGLPGATMDIFFERVEGGSPPVRIGVITNAEGGWYIAQRIELATGEWMVRVRMSAPELSEWSNPRIIRSVATGFYVATWRIRYAPLVGAIVILFIAAASMLVYSFMRVRKVRRFAKEQEIRMQTERLEQMIRDKYHTASAMMVEH